jgi:site-specific recombinase XerD
MAPRASLSSVRLQSIVPPDMAIVPLEKLIVPHALSGADGLYRLPQQRCLIGASNDQEAILAWVNARQGASADAARAQPLPREHDPVPGLHEASPTLPGVFSHTQRAYLKEAERFFLWAIVHRQKPLSSMSQEDCLAYRDFLANPQPAALWCGPRARPRWSPLWRPFEGPLSATAQRRAIAILKSLYGFLAEQSYLQCNPLAGIRLPPQSRVKQGARSLSPAHWAFVQAEMTALPQTSANRRLKLALALLHETGMRISEAVSARVADLASPPFRENAREEAQVWTLTIRRSAGKERRVPVTLNLVAELQSYLASRGLPAMLSSVPGEAFLLGRAVDVSQRAAWSSAAQIPVDRLGGIGTATLHDQIKSFFRECAGKLRKTDPTGAQILEQASAHWMRHTHGFHSVATGLSLETVQQGMGHASLVSTTRYLNGEARLRAVKPAVAQSIPKPSGSKGRAE